MKLHNTHVRLWEKHIKQTLDNYKRRAYTHCKIRTKQRYNFELTLVDYECMLNSIIARNKGVKVDHITTVKAGYKGGTVRKIIYKEIEFIVVYSNKGIKKKLIKTFLPYDEWNPPRIS